VKRTTRDLRALFRRLLPVALVLCSGRVLAQDLEPRGYTVSPLGLNVTFLGYNRTTGNLVFDPAVPITNASAKVNGGAVGYYRSLGFFGRNANVRIIVPYAWGHVKGDVFEQTKEVYRSGLADVKAQFSVNIYGAHAMPLREYATYFGQTNLWASFTMTAPTGQNSPDKLINIGSNRWGFKPELAVSQVLGKWTGELYAGVVFFTDNSEFYPGTVNRAQAPFGAYQAHVIYNFRSNLWASLDGTYWHGGHTTLDGVSKDDNQSASRLGAAVSWTFVPRHSFKVQYAKVQTIRIGGKFDSFSFGYAFSWFDPQKGSRP
jgi:outer membrane putative beta-barrel porin/alpha-amylase